MQNARLRIVRPTERLNEVVRFYQDGLANGRALPLRGP